MRDINHAWFHSILLKLKTTGHDVMSHDSVQIQLCFMFPALSPLVLRRHGLFARDLCLPNGWSAPAIAADGTVFLGNEEGRVFALRDADGDGRAPGKKGNGKGKGKGGRWKKRVALQLFATDVMMPQTFC